MSYASEILADGPHAWYRHQEASGLIQDSSGLAHHATSSAGTSATYHIVSPITSDASDWAIGAGRAVTLQEFSGIGTFDQTGTGGASSGTSVSISTSGTTVSANELVLASITGDTGQTLPWTVGSGYSEFTTKGQADGGTRTHYGEYKIVSSTGVQTATATAPDDGWHGVIATFAASSPKIPNIRINRSNQFRR